MARLYADEDFFLPLVEALRHRGHDVLTAGEAGHANQGVSDLDQLRHATSLDRALLTHNRRHYKRIHRLWPQHAGIIIVSQTDQYDREASRLDAMLQALDDLPGRLLVLNLPNP